MALAAVISLAFLTVVSAHELDPYHPHPHPPAYHTPTYQHPAPYKPLYTPTDHQPAAYKPAPAYHPTPAYKPNHEPGTPAYKPNHEPGTPACAANTTKPWCLEDAEYPTYDIKHAAEYHYAKLVSLYADVTDLDTSLSVNRPKVLAEETYLCPSETAYVRPLRAINTEGKWRVILNNVEVRYETLSQTNRVEECLTSDEACPLVPECYDSKCLQKSIYHRFLVYDAYDQYLPFAIETFKLPASCACLISAYTINH